MVLVASVLAPRLDDIIFNNVYLSNLRSLLGHFCLML
jgi:hypothetical protein